MNNWSNLRKIICLHYKIADNAIEQLQRLSLNPEPTFTNCVSLPRKLTILPKEICNLSKLQELDLNSNQLTVLPNEIGNLSQLQILFLNNNKLIELPKEIANLAQLRTINLSYNELTALPKEIANLVQLQALALTSNKLTALPKEIGNLAQLRTIDLSYNKLTALPKEIANLAQLQELNLHNNKLTNLPTEIGNLAQLRGLYLTYNKLTTLPICIIHLPNLRNLTCGNNEITNLHPAIIRWLNRSKTMQSVYNNSQSVHDHNIESSTNASIIKFVSCYQVKQSNVFDLIDGLSITAKTKNLLKAYCNCDYVHSNLKLTFDEVALPVLDYINNDTNKQDLLKILDDEITQSEGKCYQGRLTRLINVLNGYHPDVNINISANEQIGNIVIMLKKQYPDIDPTTFIKLFVKEMNERNYGPDVITEWSTHVEENY